MGMCEGVFHKKCAAKLKGFNETELCEDCQTPVKPQSSINTDPSKITMEKVLREVNEKLAVVHKMEKTLDEMSNDISFYSAKYQELIEDRDKANNRIKALEHRNNHLETCNRALEERVTWLETKEKEKNVEIVGLEDKDDVILENVIQQLARKLGVDDGQIHEIQRVGVKPAAVKPATANKQNEGRSSQPRPRPVVITMATRAARDQWLAARKTIKLCNNDVFENGNKDFIYINEDLTKYTRNLLWTAKNELKPTYKYVWVKEGKVLIRKDDPADAKIRVVRSLNDIDALLNDEK
ncbi:uncharacterized protein LOC134652394 [Cydia amplana]|uniref:uncharacterized protein LOC134652394 n=1 Tax=Cydia amplana TaxID=1869771 RepID=UPI002FE5378D